MGPACSRNAGAAAVYSPGHVPGHVRDGQAERTSFLHAMLLHVPSEILVFWVLPLLSVKSLVRLDSAMNGGFLSNDVVAQMRQLYGSDRNITRLGNMRKEAWMLSRGIYPVNIKLFCGVNDKEICSKHDIARCARAVSLNYCWMLSAPAIASFLTGCTSVTALDLGYCTGKTSVCFAIAHNCPQLTALSLYGAERISFSGLQLVMQRCTQLVELRLSYSSGLTFYNLLHIVSTLCQNLHTLHLAGLSTVSNFTLSHLKCPALTELNISDCRHAVGAGCLLALAECPSLCVLYASCRDFNGPVRAPSVLPLAQNCAMLKELDLSRYTQLQPDAVLALVQHSAHLRRLVLDRCACITDATLLSVAAQGASSLKELSVKNCHSVTAEGVLAFQQQSAHCCRVYYGEYPDASL
jgi:hypothetical protein